MLGRAQDNYWWKRRFWLRFVVPIVVAAMVVGAVITLIATRGGSSSEDVLTEALSTPTRPAGTATQSSTALLAGFAYPIAGACLPKSETLIPGAPREYRMGVHEGVDFYHADNCTAIGVDTEVLAARAGVVVRADLIYEELTAETLAVLMERVEQEGGSGPDVTDAFRGRQVWVDHGAGIVTRYAHLNGIAEGVRVGTEVARGALIAFVGESGTPASVTAPGTQYHLHFEIRIGEGYLGEGAATAEVRALYEQALVQ